MGAALLRTRVIRHLIAVPMLSVSEQELTVDCSHKLTAQQVFLFLSRNVVVGT